MSKVPFPTPARKEGKLILIATAVAKPGQGDQLQKLVAAVRARAESSVEPNTLTYRTTRGIEGTEETFVIFEEYVLPNGIEEHMSAEFKALGDSGCVASLDIKYYEEFKN